MFAGHRVVARRLDGSLMKGYTYNFDPGRPHFHIFPSRDASVDPHQLFLKDLKAVFSVRDFAGNPAHRERKQFVAGQRVPGRKVEVTFVDREVLVGSTRDYHPAASGFVLIPADPLANNLQVFVVSTAVRHVRVLPDSSPRQAVRSTSRGNPFALPRNLLAWLKRSEATPSARETTVVNPRQPSSAPASSRAATDSSRPSATPPLLDRLIRTNLLTSAQLREICSEQRRTGERLPTVLKRLGLLSVSEIVDALGHEYGLPVIDLERIEVAEDTLRLVDRAIVTKHHVFPVRKVGRALTLAVSDPTTMASIDDVRFATGLQVIPVLASDRAIREAIDKHYADGTEEMNGLLTTADLAEADALTPVLRVPETVDVTALTEEAGEAPAIRLVNRLLADAIRKRASDIHLEPDEQVFRVRYRIDGVLHDIMAPPRQLEAAVLSRVKIMANMDIAERRLPQDGRITVNYSGREIDLRCSSLPTLYGEKFVLRILQRSHAMLHLPELGFEPDDLDRFRRAIEIPSGIILITGPTGSGKTTTLYAAVSAINSPAVNVVSVEDPVEYHLPRVNQVNVREHVGLSFQSALRALLRQDPDVILVGEMRDAETASIALRAAMTGHLVFSTLHTNDAPSTIARLFDIGIAPFMVASAVRMVVGQRLCRRICSQCRERVEMPLSSLLDAGFRPEMVEAVAIYRGAGCPNCANTGYRDRIAIHEVLEVTAELQDAIGRQAPTRELKELAIKHDMRTLREAGLRKVAQGVTTLEEIARVTSPNDPCRLEFIPRLGSGRAVVVQ